MRRLWATLLVLAAASSHAEPSVEVSVGGGVSAFSDTTARRAIDVGGAWDLRLTVRPRRFVAGELAYVGSANPVSSTMNDFFTPGGVIMGGGVESNLRLQLPYVVEPYVFGGVGWNHFALVYSSLRSSNSMHGGENVAAFPFGGGVQTFLNRSVAVDARVTYRLSPGEDVVVENNGTGVLVARGLGNWTAAARVGLLF